MNSCMFEVFSLDEKQTKSRAGTVFPDIENPVAAGPTHWPDDEGSTGGEADVSRAAAWQ